MNTGSGGDAAVASRSDALTGCSSGALRGPRACRDIYVTTRDDGAHDDDDDDEYGDDDDDDEDDGPDD